MAAFSTPDSRKSVVQDAAVEEAVDHLLHIGTEKTISFCKTVVPVAAGLKRIETVFDTLIILRLLGLSEPVGR